MLDPQREIQALVDSFVDDLSELAKRIAIEQIKAAFEFGAPSLPPYTSSGAGAPSSRGPAAALTDDSPAPGRRGRRPARELEGLRERLVAAIAEQPGRRTEDLNAALGTETAQIAPVLRKLVAEQHIRTEGARRGTRYFSAGSAGGHSASGAAPASAPSDTGHDDDDDHADANAS